MIGHFVDGTTSRINAYPSAVLEATLSFVASDHPHTYWLSTNGPQRQDDRLALIRDIVDAMPEVDLIRILYEVFITRCQGPSQQCCAHTNIHEPSRGVLWLLGSCFIRSTIYDPV